MSYLTRLILFQDQTLHGRVQMAILEHTADIEDEPPDTPGHEARARLASMATIVPDEVGRRFIPYLVRDPRSDTYTSQDQVSDGLLAEVVAQYWDRVAGYGDPVLPPQV